MKKQFLILLSIVSLSVSGQLIRPTTINSAYSQREEEVLRADKLIFYGWDFTYMNLVHDKWLGRDMTTQVLLWGEFLRERFTTERLRSQFGKEVTLNFTPTYDRARKINGMKVVSPFKKLIDKDSLQSYVNSCRLPDNQGVGVIVFLECFEKNGKRTSGYYVYVDLATKEIMMAEYFFGREADGYGLTGYWGQSILGTHANYTKTFKKRMIKLGVPLYMAD